MKSLTRAVVPFLSMLSVIALLGGCSIERPRVSSQFNRGNNKAGFDHVGVTSGCAACHAATLPSKHIALNGADCSACHKPSGWTITAANAHVPRPKACASCHGAGGAFNRFKPEHKPIEGRDCVGCHSTSTWKVDATSVHQPPPTSCLSCHGPGSPYDRLKPTHKPIGTRDCVACHVPTDWKKIGAAHSPLPSACSNCHEPDRPSLARLPRGGALNGHYEQKDCFACHQTTGYRFAHLTAAQTNIGFCLPCHDQQGRRKHARKHPDYFNGDGACARCHSYRSGWDD